MATILVVDDEKLIADIVAYNLKKEHFKVLTAYDGQQALEILEKASPDLILLDIMMPEINGFDVCKAVREKYIMPIIMLTALDDTEDKVTALEYGADDYINKPFVMKELIARVKANLRRMTMCDKNQSSVTQIGDLVVDESLYEIRKDDIPLNLTTREYEIVKFLASNPGRVFSREELLREIWGYEYFGDDRNVDTTISRLRDKLSDDKNKYIKTKRGKGYYYKPQ